MDPTISNTTNRVPVNPSVYQQEANVGKGENVKQQVAVTTDGNRITNAELESFEKVAQGGKKQTQQTKTNEPPRSASGRAEMLKQEVLRRTEGDFSKSVLKNALPAKGGVLADSLVKCCETASAALKKLDGLTGEEIASVKSLDEDSEAAKTLKDAIDEQRKFSTELGKYLARPKNGLTKEGKTQLLALKTTAKNRAKAIEDLWKDLRTVAAKQAKSGLKATEGKGLPVLRHSGFTAGIFKKELADGGKGLDALFKNDKLLKAEYEKLAGQYGEGQNEILARKLIGNVLKAEVDAIPSPLKTLDDKFGRFLADQDQKFLNEVNDPDKTELRHIRYDYVRDVVVDIRGKIAAADKLLEEYKTTLKSRIDYCTSRKPEDWNPEEIQALDNRINDLVSDLNKAYEKIDSLVNRSEYDEQLAIEKYKNDWEKRNKKSAPARLASLTFNGSLVSLPEKKEDRNPYAHLGLMAKEKQSDPNFAKYVEYTLPNFDRLAGWDVRMSQIDTALSKKSVDAVANALTDNDVNALMEGRMNFSSAVEAKIWNPGGEFRNDLDGKELVESKVLGSGQFNTVKACKFAGADGKVVEKVFKGEVGATNSMEVGALNRYLCADESHTGALASNVAAQKVAGKIGCGDVFTKTTFGMLGDEHGMFMEKAKGVQQSEFDDFIKDPSLLKTAKLNDDKTVCAKLLGNDNLKALFCVEATEKLNNLQWLDVVTGQMDRHLGNAMIGVDSAGRAEVKGIDNDENFSDCQIGCGQFLFKDEAELEDWVRRNVRPSNRKGDTPADIIKAWKDSPTSPIRAYSLNDKKAAGSIKEKMGGEMFEFIKGKYQNGGIYVDLRDWKKAGQAVPQNDIKALAKYRKDLGQINGILAYAKTNHAPKLISKQLYETIRNLNQDDFIKMLADSGLSQRQAEFCWARVLYVRQCVAENKTAVVDWKKDIGTVVRTVKADLEKDYNAGESLEEITRNEKNWDWPENVNRPNDTKSEKKWSLRAMERDYTVRTDLFKVMGFDGDAESVVKSVESALASDEVAKILAASNKKEKAEEPKPADKPKPKASPKRELLQKIKMINRGKGQSVTTVKRGNGAPQTVASVKTEKPVQPKTAKESGADDKNMWSEIPGDDEKAAKKVPPKNTVTPEKRPTLNTRGLKAVPKGASSKTIEGSKPAENMLLKIKGKLRKLKKDAEQPSGVAPKELAKKSVKKITNRTTKPVQGTTAKPAQGKKARAAANIAWSPIPENDQPKDNLAWSPIPEK